MLVIKGCKFVDGGLSRNKGIIKMVRNKDKMLYMGTVVIYKHDDTLRAKRISDRGRLTRPTSKKVEI